MEITFDIELIGDVTESDSVITKTNYLVKSEDKFESVVTVGRFKFEQPFVTNHRCKMGGELLWSFTFWNQLQDQVLSYHKQNKKQNEKRN